MFSSTRTFSVPPIPMPRLHHSELHAFFLYNKELKTLWAVQSNAFLASMSASCQGQWKTWIHQSEGRRKVLLTTFRKTKTSYSSITHGLFCSVLCFTVPRYTSLCSAELLCCTALGYAALSAVLCCTSLRYAVLRYAALLYATLCCAALCYTMLCCAVLCCTSFCCAALSIMVHCAVQRYVVLRYAALCCAMLYCAAQHIVLLCCTIHYGALCCAALRRVHCYAALLCCTVLSRFYSILMYSSLVNKV